MTREEMNGSYEGVKQSGPALLNATEPLLHHRAMCWDRLLGKSLYLLQASVPCLPWGISPAPSQGQRDQIPS